MRNDIIFLVAMVATRQSVYNYPLDSGWSTSILHRMEVMLMKKKFDFKDLMSFGMFLPALLTFIYMICH